MATQSDNGLSAEQVQTAISRVLLEKIRTDTYPSYTHMNLLEQSLPQSLQREYVSVLLEKVVDERFPSPSMLRRIQRFAA